MTTEPTAYSYGEADRLNLPTGETALAMRDEERVEHAYEPGTAPSPWPKLWWERGELQELPKHGPLYVHDKLSPVEFVQSIVRRPGSRDMFSDFNGLPDEASYQPYQHRSNWQNRLARATGQRMMASLIHREGMAGQVDMVYMDPPYNINFRSNFQGRINELNVGEGWDELPADPTPIKAFRDNYERGVHSYLDQLLVQLELVRVLLRDSGSVFMQIGPDNLHPIAMLMSEVFGHGNHVATIPYMAATNQSGNTLPEIGNWLVWFGKDRKQMKYRQLYEPVSRAEIVDLFGRYCRVRMLDGTIRRLTKDEKSDPDLFLPEGARLLQTNQTKSQHRSTTDRSDPIEFEGHIYSPGDNSQWRVSLDGMSKLYQDGRLNLNPKDNSIRWYAYEDEIPGRFLTANWGSVRRTRDKMYAVQTPDQVVERCILMTTDPGDLILDPLCGSGTTAWCAEKWGRRWIISDASAVAVAIARQRLATATFDYHILQDSEEGAAKEAELSGRQFIKEASYGNDPAKGFVCERQPKISAATLAYEEVNDTIVHVDRTMKARGVTRVTSAFTVESDSPFRSEGPDTHSDFQEADESNLATRDRILEALVTSGITFPNAGRWIVSDLREWPDARYVSHIGHLTNADTEEVRRAAFYIADEDITVSAGQSRAASGEAMMMGYNAECLVIVSFSREGMASEVERKQGRLTVFHAMANRDLMIPELESREDDTAFVVLSEPDVELSDASGGQLQVEVKGLDVYNPRTGTVEPSDPRNIACIMVDTDYDGESFRARRVNFPGAGDRNNQLKQLKKAFNREVDDDKWATMLTARTVPFDPPGSDNRIAVKVVDNAGMEHMRVLHTVLRPD